MVVCFMTTRLIILIPHYFVFEQVEAEYLRQQTSDSRWGYIYRSRSQTCLNNFDHITDLSARY